MTILGNQPRKGSKKWRIKSGITIITLTITVIIFVIVSNILIYNAKDSLYVKKLQNMYNDVQNLRDKVIEYSVQYGTIPANKNVEYSLEGKDELKQVMTAEELQTGKFYAIDLKTLDGLTLNYGRDYEKITEDMATDEISQLTDLYIVSELTKNVYYVEGVSVKGQRYFTDKEMDTTEVDLKYPDGKGLPVFSIESNKNYLKLYNGFVNVKLTLKNYNEEWSTDLDATYEVKIKTNEKFKIDVTDDNNGIIKGGQENENLINVDITSVPNVILERKEKLVLAIVIKEPIYKELLIPLTIELPDLTPGYMNDYRKVRFSDVQNSPNEYTFNEMYGDNNMEFEYAEDGSIVLDQDNVIPIFDRSERNYENGYTVYMTFKADASQLPNDRWGPATLFAMSMESDGVLPYVNRVCWFGFRNNNFQLYSYRHGNPPQDLDYEYEEDGVLSKNFSEYSNRIVNLQITGEIGGKTNI